MNPKKWCGVVLNGVKSAYNGISSAISVGTDLMGGIGKVGKMAKGFGGGRAAPSNGGGVLIKSALIIFPQEAI